MKKRLGIIATIAFLFAGQTVHARGDGDLWVMVVGPMCLSQFPEYADTELGKLFLRGADIDSFVSRPFAQCFRQHNWASSALCAELAGLQREQMRDLQTVHEHHRAEIRGMKPAFDYFNAYVAQDPRSSAWPFKCPEVSR